MKKIFISFFLALAVFSPIYSAPPDFTNYSPRLDSEIRQKIDNMIRTGSFNRPYAFVTFQVDRGFVYLQGHVETEQDINLLEAKISEITGVVGIKDDIKVYELKSRFPNPPYPY